MIKKIQLRPKQVLTNDDIYRIIMQARQTWQYAKFTTANKKYWISVSFQRDLTIIITTNCRDMGLYYEMNFTMKIRTVQAVANLLFRWLPRLNELP